MWAMSFNKSERGPEFSIDDNENDLVSVLEQHILTEIVWSDEHRRLICTSVWSPSGKYFLVQADLVFWKTVSD